MLVVISPSKTQDFSEHTFTDQYSLPEHLEESQLLIDTLKKLDQGAIGSLMGISEKLANLNYERFRAFDKHFSPENAKQAILAFKGDVYNPIDVAHYSEDDFQFLQQHLRIISGLYGILRPLDLIQPYRLEMKTKLANQRGDDLYAFWGSELTDTLNSRLKAGPKPVLVNLASNEYWHAINPKSLDADVITPVFKEKKNDQYKVIGLFAKRARGMMVDYIVKQRIADWDKLKSFNIDGYQYNADLSKEFELVFTRG